MLSKDRAIPSKSQAVFGFAGNYLDDTFFYPGVEDADIRTLRFGV